MPMGRADMRVVQAAGGTPEQLLPQRSLAVRGLVHTALLQDRNDQIDEILQALRRHHAAGDKCLCHTSEYSSSPMESASAK